jgi:hypothetical protein
VRELETRDLVAILTSADPDPKLRLKRIPRWHQLGTAAATPFSTQQVKGFGAHVLENLTRADPDATQPEV